MRGAHKLSQLTDTQMWDRLEAVLQTVIPYVDDGDDLDLVMAEEVDRALRQGLITPQMHRDFYWHLGIER